MSAAPPRLAEALLRAALPRGVEGQSIVGDLREEYLLLAAREPTRARRWYWRQSASVAARLTWARATATAQDARTGLNHSLAARLRPDGWLADVRHAARRLARHPTVSAAAVLSIALGTGAVGALFGVLDAVVLRPLPYADAERLVHVAHAHAERGARPGTFSPQDFADVSGAARSYDGWASYWHSPGQSVTNLAGGAEPLRIEVAYVSGEFFELLGRGAALGRLIGPRDAIAGDDRVIVLGHALWQSAFGAAPDVVGRELRVDGEPFVVIGVAPEWFRYPAVSVRAFVPLSLIQDDDIPHVRGLRWLHAIARLPPHGSARTAESETTAVLARLAAAYPDSNAGYDRAVVTPLRESLVGDARDALLLLFGATLFVQLLVGANLTALLLARGVARSGEIAVTLALGASRLRVLRQSLAESVLLTGAGSLAGLGLAVLGIRALAAWSAGTVPRVEELGASGRLVGFTIVVALASGALFGLLPALRACRVEPASTLRGAGLGNRVSRSLAWMRGLAVAETALACVLVVGAGLLLRSFDRLVRVDPGFRAERVLALSVSLRDTEFESDSTRRLAAQRELIGAISEVPGVIAVGGSKTAPLAGGGEPYRFTQDLPDAPSRTLLPGAGTFIVTPGYFAALGVRLLGGRDFAWHEPRPVMIVNRSLAEQLWPGGDAVGRGLRIGDVPLEVVGLVDDVRHDGLARAGGAAAYVPAQQAPRSNLEIFVRSAGEPATIAAGVREAIRGEARALPVANLGPLAERVSAHVARPRFFAALLSGFGALALAIAGLGLYGVLHYAVSQRTGELGLRQALGASAADLRRMVVFQSLRLSLTGAVVGCALALWLGGALRGLLYGVGPQDPATFAAVVAVLGGVSALAAYGPARRATRADPARALRAL